MSNGVFDVLEEVQKDLERGSGKMDTPNIRVKPVSIEELKVIVKKMSRRKAPDPDNVTTDWIKGYWA